jgi:hypothetical protein
MMLEFENEQFKRYYERRDMQQLRKNWFLFEASIGRGMA